jgi:hypothetical protein
VGQVDWESAKDRIAEWKDFKFGAPHTPLTKNGASRSVLVRPAPNFVVSVRPAPNYRSRLGRPRGVRWKTPPPSSRSSSSILQPSSRKPQTPTLKLTQSRFLSHPSVTLNRVNSTCANGHQRLAVLDTVRSGDALLAAVCPDCRAVTWWLNGAEIECWDGAMLGFGRAVVLEKLAAVGAPGDEVLICRPPAGTRLAWLPTRRWVEAAPQLFVAREGRRLLMSSPNPALTGVMTSQKSHLALLKKPVPV